MKNQLFVFDVESIGLYGDGFAFGYVVLDTVSLQTVTEGGAYCDPFYAGGYYEARQWVAENVSTEGLRRISSLQELRRDFWEKVWTPLADSSVMMADCPVPVEANFITACMRDVVGVNNSSHFAQSPYPVLDIASVLFACGVNPLSNFPRASDELPEHHPLMDARQSARVLREVVQRHGVNVAAVMCQL